MGVYGQTNYEIICDNPDVAQAVAEQIKEIPDDNQGNSWKDSITNIDGERIEGYMDSGRIPNLEYKCQELWNRIKERQGVIEANFPFLIESDGLWFSNDTDH
jgi:hypothetical protein